MVDQAKRLHASIHGRVQAVSFRYFAIQAAKPLGLTGWVRNRFNGAVELVAEGEESKLQELLEIIKRGPSSAIVSDVLHSWETATGEFKKFNIRMTR